MDGKLLGDSISVKWSGRGQIAMRGEQAPSEKGLTERRIEMEWMNKSLTERRRVTIEHMTADYLPL